MIEIEYSSRFVGKFKKLDRHLQDEVVEKIERFRDPTNHRSLALHRLGGVMKEQWAFSVSYSDRIVIYFSKGKKIAHLLDIGDHSIYE